jgi:hypothetical protein
MSEPNIVNVENTWLLRIITGMASFISIMLMLLFNTLSNKFDKLETSVAYLSTTVGKHEVWIGTFNNAQTRMESNLDNFMQNQLNSNKLYALKPDDVKIKREN